MAGLPGVSKEAIKEYQDKGDRLIARMNDVLGERAKKEQLTGVQPLEILFDNHKNHHKYLSYALELETEEGITNMVKWVFDSYVSRGFKKRYFKIALNYWKRFIEEELSEHAAQEIIPYYDLMLDVVKEQDGTVDPSPVQLVYVNAPPYEQVKKKLYHLLLDGEYKKCTALTEECLKSSCELKAFYFEVIRPVMVQIGLDWENGVIAFYQEHLATSIIMRLMTDIYMKYHDQITRRKGKIAFLTPPEEQHRLGLTMLMDLLEFDGWEVLDLKQKAATPDTIRQVVEFKPHIIALSVTMVYHLPKAEQVIQRFRDNEATKDVKILIGGYAATVMGTSKGFIDADLWMDAQKDPIEFINEWWDQHEMA